MKDTLEQFYSIKVEHSTIIRWVQKYVQIVKEFVDGLTPNLSGIYHVDEMMIHVKKDKIEQGQYAWMWNLSDHNRRLLLASRVSQRRDVRDARAVFQDGKRIGKAIPMAVVHDGLHTYTEAFKKEFFTLKGPRTEEIRSVRQEMKV
ncbi:MAG: DDE-type integrase/transposase/recombinase [Conexivisphaerales archaeon]